MRKNIYCWFYLILVFFAGLFITVKQPAHSLFSSTTRVAQLCCIPQTLAPRYDFLPEIRASKLLNVHDVLNQYIPVHKFINVIQCSPTEAFVVVIPRISQCIL
jgi:hypothetical protein